MKKLLMIILLLSCNKFIGNMNFKNKDINDDLVLAINTNDTDKIIELIKQGANINYISNNKSILKLSLNNKNLKIVEELLKKGVEVNRDNIVKIYDLALEDFNCDVIDLVKDKYKLEEGLVDKNKYFLLLCYTSNSSEVEKFIEKNSLDPKEIRDIINRNALIISAAGNKIDIFETMIEKYGLNINYKNSNGTTPLMFASHKNSKEIVKLLIRKGANVNDKDAYGYTPLILASSDGHKEIVKILLERGANIDDYREDNCTALMLASKNGYREVVELLIEGGANINYRNDIGVSALMLASFKGHTEVVKLLIRKGANVNNNDINDYSILMIASQKGHLEIVNLLIEEGALINYSDSWGWTALTMAFNNSHKEIVKLLIERGANVNSRISPLILASQNGYIEIVNLLLEKGINVNIEDFEGNTPLILASSNGHKEIVKILLERGASVNSRISPLMLASKNGYTEIVNILLEKGVNVNSKNSERCTSLILASENGHKETVKILLERGANINDYQVDGRTALMSASSNGHTEVVELLIKAGANIYHRDAFSNTSLILASQKGHKKVVKVLLERGANVNDKNSNGATPLMAASYQNNKEIAKLLIEKGADVNDKNNDGWTSLMIASVCNLPELVKLLIEKGANINDKNTLGETALVMVFQDGCKEIVKLLIENFCEITNEIKLHSIIEELIIYNIKNKDIEGCLFIISNYKNDINFNFKDDKGNTFLHYAAIANNCKLFNLFLNNKIDINSINNKGKTPLYYALSHRSIDENFIWYLLNKNAILKPFIHLDKIINVLSPFNDLCYKIVYNPLIKMLLGDIDLSFYDKANISKVIKLVGSKNNLFNKYEMIKPNIIEIIKLIKSKSNVFNSYQMEYIRYFYNFKYNKIKVVVNEIDNLHLDDNIEDIELDIDFLVGSIFDLETKKQYYGGENLDEVKKNFKSRLKNIAKTKTPTSIPSIIANEEDKTNYIKYLTKKKLRDLGRFLTNLNTQEREEKIVSIMNYLLINLTCHVGTLEAVTNAYNSLSSNEIDKDLKEVIGREFMLYRIKLIEETAKKYFNNSNRCKIVSRINNIIVENSAEYNEHMKAYLVMDLKEELKVTGLYEKDFVYRYDKQFIINEVKRLYKEKALEYIIEIILKNSALQNKILEYIQSNIFKNIISNNENLPTVLHIENFINDEKDKITKESIIALLLHFDFLKVQP